MPRRLHRVALRIQRNHLGAETAAEQNVIDNLRLPTRHAHPHRGEDQHYSQKAAQQVMPIKHIP